MLSGNSKYSHLRVNVMKKLEPGQAFLAEKGQDFFCQPESFRQVVYELAKTYGLGYKGTAVVINGYVVYAFFHASDYMRPNLPAYPIVKKLRGEA